MHITEFVIDDISLNDDIVIKTSFYDSDMKDLIIRSAIKDHVTNLIYQQKYDDDPFGFKKSNRYLADITKDDEEFRTFMKEKYI